LTVASDSGRAEEARRLLDEGYAHTNSADESEALALFERAVSLLDDLPDSELKADALNAVGLARHRRGDHGGALVAFEGALEVATAVGYTAVEAGSWHNIGLMHQRSGRHEAALAAYERAAPLLELSEDLLVLPITWHGIAAIHAAENRPDAAVVAFERALALLDAAPNPRERTLVLVGLARVLARLGRADEADRRMDEAARGHGAPSPGASRRLRVRFLLWALRRGRLGLAGDHARGLLRSGADGGSRRLGDFLAALHAAMPRRLWTAGGLMLAAAATEGVGLLMLLPLLQLVGLEVGGGSFGEIAVLLRGALRTVGLTPTLGTVLPLYVAIVIVTALLGRMAAWSAASLSHGYAARLRSELQAALAQASWLFHTRGRASDVTHVLTTEASRVVMATDALLSLVVRGATTVIYLGVALAVAPAVTVVVAVVAGGLVFAFRRTSRRLHAIGSEIVEANARMFDAIGEDLGGLKLIKGHGVEARSMAAFAGLAERVAERYLASARVQLDVAFGFRAASVVLLSVLVYAAVTWFGLGVAALLLLIYVYARLGPMVQSLQGTYQTFVAHLPAYAAVRALRDASLAASEHIQPATDLVELRDAVTMEGVRFAYDPRRYVLDGVSLTIPAGRTTAVVGPSGGGKSTLADLLIGLLTPDEGALAVDGRRLDASWLQGWRNSVGYVPQDAFVFHASVRANLLVTRPDASDEDVWAALEQASARAFVEVMPEGLDTVLGDRGVRISGGERQRIALARALLRRPALLVLDEATSNLDVDNERHVQRAVDALRGSLTIVMIAHRLATVRNADRIHVVAAGRVIESGTWPELVALPGGRFRAMCVEQGLVDDGRPTPAAGRHVQ
jgi:ATP-binding cassette, subfamily C, bacterial